MMISRLSIRREHILGLSGYDVLMFDGQIQIGREDEPGVMIIGFSDNDLVISELSEADIKAVQQNKDEIIAWIQDRGYDVISPNSQ